MSCWDILGCGKWLLLRNHSNWWAVFFLFSFFFFFFSFFLKVALILILEIVPRIWIKNDQIISLFNSAHRMISRNIWCHCTNIDIMGSVYFLGIFLWYQNFLHENTTTHLRSRGLGWRVAFVSMEDLFFFLLILYIFLVS